MGAAWQIIRGGQVLDIDARHVGPADILIAGDTIHEIGAPGLAAPESAVEIDATDRLVMPGLVNAHTHGHGSLGKGLGDKWSLELLLNAAPWTSGGFTLEDKRLAAQLNAAEMVLKGCTAAYDMYFEFPTASTDGVQAIVEGYRDLGLRVTLAPMMADITLFRAIPGLLDALPDPLRHRAEAMATAPSEQHIAVCREILEGWAFDRDTARPALGPTIPLHCTDAFLTACRDLAAEHDTGIQMHLAESKVQAVAAQTRYGKTLAAHLDSLGILGPSFTGAHCVWLDDEDLRRMADQGASVAHNPGSNLRLGSGIARARAMREHGIPVGIGSDGSGSSDNQNMFEALRLAAFVSRTQRAQPEEWLGTWEVLDMATQGGARVLGLEDRIGRIAPDYKADLVFLDLTHVNYVPLNDAANQIVNCEDSSAVDSVMIGGRMVLQGGAFTDFDFDALRAKVAESVARLAERNADKHDVAEMMARYVSSHCVGLACHGS
ncbi:amidohydrolase family protein [Roseovarius aestuariivivens]|uniref:amidohydrolase family protein n=1 Tax=Roseovarius aestuariivivens TaxID=1888910 RepID=UPI0010801BDD|nr:amidohydrolase family protein [Roseovarius aestuariivivens]